MVIRWPINNPKQTEPKSACLKTPNLWSQAFLKPRVDLLILVKELLQIWPLDFCFAGSELLFGGQLTILSQQNQNLHV